MRKKSTTFNAYSIAVTPLYSNILLDENILFRYRFWMIGIGCLFLFVALWIAAVNYFMKSKTKALYESNEWLNRTQILNKAIINTIPDMIFIIDNETRVLEYKLDGSEKLISETSKILMLKLSELLPNQIGEKLIDEISEITRINELKYINFEITDQEPNQHFEMRLVRSGKNELIALIRNMTSHFINLENIKYLSNHDKLTGLYNRYMFDEEISRLDVTRNFPLTIIMADINGLKLTNDCFGHQVGDELLVQFSQILKNAFRADEILCRIGGDEFVIILPQTSNEVAIGLIERISASCEEVKFLKLPLSVAFGCSTKYTSRESISVVMKYAEDQMYKRKLFESPKIKERMVDHLLQSLFVDIETEETHAKMVEKYSVALGEDLQLDSTEMEILKTAALYHDIGKIAIDKEILLKKTPLNSEEIECLKMHTDIGYRILSAVNGKSECADVILAHHERWDGLGYPKGLAGNQIPLMSKVIALADAYATMIHERLYKELTPRDEALKEIENCSGTQFDPILVEKFILVMRQMNGEEKS